MFDLIFAVLLFSFLVLQGIFSERDTAFYIRIILMFGLLPISSVFVILEFFLWNGGSLAVVIISVGFMICIIGFIFMCILGE